MTEEAKTIKNAIARKYPSINIDDNLESAIKAMAAHNSSALVVKMDETLIGLITVSDIIHSLAQGNDRHECRASSFMTKCDIIATKGTKNPCVQLDEDMDVESAITVMHEAGVNHLLVTGDRGEPVGVVTSLELVKLLAQ